MAAWVWPTVRAISWVPLAAISACLAVLTLGSAHDGAWPVGITGLAAAAVAGAVTAGMHDPAAALLAAVPTSAARRRVRRIALLVPVGLAVWLATIDGSLLGLLALTTTGLAVSVWTGLLLGVAVPMTWAVTAYAAEVDWEQRPSLMLLAASAALWTGRNR